MSDTYRVLGSAESGEQEWNALLDAFDGGYEGLQRLADRTFSDLDTQDWVDEYREDLTQDAICEVFRSLHTWDQSREPGPWAATVMRHKMLRKLSSEYRRIDQPVDPEEFTEMLVYQEDGFDEVVRQDTIDYLRRTASDADREVIDKVLADQPLSDAERKRWRRYRDRLKEAI